jgi:hypothetical protein
MPSPKAVRPATKTPARTHESTRCGPLQQAIANRARIVLSLCDQRAETALSLPVVAAGMSRYLDRADYQEHSMVSRLLRAHRNWRPEHLYALTQFATEFGLIVDPGWLAFGPDSDASVPVVPADCPMRPDTTLTGPDGHPIVRRSGRTLAQLIRTRTGATRSRA